MKNLIAILALLFGSFAAADSNKVPHDLAVKVEEVHLRLGRVQAAAHAITPESFNRIHAAFGMATEVLVEVVNSNLSDDAKTELVGHITGDMGMTFNRVVRHPGLDQHDAEIQIDSNTFFPDQRKRVLSVLAAPHLLRLYSDDLGNRTIGIAEVRRRDRLAIDLANQWKTFAEQHFNKLDQSLLHADRIGARIEGFAKKAITLRQFRHKLNFYAANIATGLGLFLFLNPIDPSSQVTFFSTFVSGVTYLAAFMTQATIRYMASGSAVIKTLEHLVEVIKDPTAADIEAIKARKANFKAQIEAEISRRTAEAAARGQTFDAAAAGLIPPKGTTRWTERPLKFRCELTFLAGS